MLRRLLRLLVVLSVIAVLAVVAIWLLTNTDFGRERVRRMALSMFGGATHGIMKIVFAAGSRNELLEEVKKRGQGQRAFVSDLRQIQEAAGSIDGRFHGVKSGIKMALLQRFRP